MTNMEDVIQRIKMLECPTGHVEERITKILKDYGVATKSEITIKRHEEIDNDGVQVYTAQLSKDRKQFIRILASSGLDDYVAKVVDVYIK